MISGVVSVMTSGSDKSQIQSLAKGFRVLETFSAEDRELTLSEIAGRVGLDPGTVFRILSTLTTLGYLDRVSGTKRFRLTLRVLDLGFHAIARTELRDLARPILRSLVGRVNEAASLATLDGDDVVYLERVHAGLVRLGVDTRIGSRLPAYYTALGHAILAHLPRDDQLRVLNMRERVLLTPSTPTTIAEIDARMEGVRRDGYALSDQEVVAGMRVMAAPVLDADGLPSAAVSVAAPAHSLPLKEFVSQTAPPLLDAAAAIGKAIRCSGATTLQTHRPTLNTANSLN